MYHQSNTVSLIRFLLIAPIVGIFLFKKLTEALYASGLETQTRITILVFAVIFMIILFLKGIDRLNR